MTGNPIRKAYLFAVLAVLFWSTSPTAFKLGLREQDPYQLLTGASYVSLFVLGMIILLQRKQAMILKTGWRELGFSAIMGMLNPVAYYLILFKAYSLLPAQVAQPLNMIWPLVLVLLSIPLLKQRISWKSIGTMLISFAGVVVVSMQGGAGSGDPDNRLGIFLALSTSVIWALYFIYNARNSREPVTGLFLNFLFASLYLTLGGLFVDHPFPLLWEDWATAAYVGIFEMGVTFVLWLTAIRIAPATDRISNLVYAAPFLNLLFVHLVLKERIFMTTVYGIILLVSGILLQTMVNRNARNF